MYVLFSEDFYSLLMELAIGEINVEISCKTVSLYASNSVGKKKFQYKQFIIRFKDILLVLSLFFYNSSTTMII